MESTSSLKNVMMTDSLERYLRSAHSEKEHVDSHGPNPLGPDSPYCIAISREAGAGGAEIAELLGRHLGWSVYDRSLIESIGKDMGLQTDLLESVDEKQTHWLQAQLDAFFVGPTVSTYAYLHRLVKILLALSAKGACVVVGRGSTQVMPMERTLRVRLVASEEDRIARIRRRQNLDPRAAAVWMRDHDRHRTGFVRDHFQMDASDAHHYDLVLNTSRFSCQQCTDLIVQGLREMDMHVATRKHQAAAAV